MARRVKVCDGGFSTQLSKYVSERVDGDPLWTAKFLKLHPDECALVHKDFVIAGAEVISTGTYQSSIEGYKQYLDLDEGEALSLMKYSVKLAKKGIRMAEEEIGSELKVKIAGSIGPYGAFLHDGSEYNGSYCDKVSEEELIAWHRPRVDALIAAGVDLLALETLPCLKEALALIRLLKEYPSTKAWIAFSIKDGQSISNGETFCEVAEQCWKESDQLIAVGANCFHPSLVSPLLKNLRDCNPSIPTIVYPNNGEKYDSINGRWLNKESNVNIEDYVEEWLDLGVVYLGGCCRTDSQDISQITKKVSEWETKISNI